MSTRLLLDGTDLAGLVAQVRAEYGPEAKIIKAERVRTGGIAGFFASEHYELTIEVPDRQAVGPLPRARRTRTAGAARDGTAALAAAPGDPAPVDPGPRDPDPGDARPAKAAAAGEVDMTALLEAADAAEHAQNEPQVSTSTDAFASVLESVRRLADAPEAADIVAPPPLAVEAGREVEPGRAQRGAGPADHESSHAEPDTSTPPPFEPIVLSAVPRTGARRRHPRPSLRASLLRLGVPEGLLADSEDGAGAGASVAEPTLSDLLAGLERPPRLVTTPGAIVAVVGEGEDAVATARQMAGWARLDTQDVVLAGHLPAVTGHGRRMTTHGAVERFRERARSAEVPSLVAVGAGRDGSHAELAAELVAALDPHQCWVVVDARHKAGDLRRWIRTVCGEHPVDAVAAVAVHDTEEPGTVLDVGVPVGWIDGLPASPVVWAALFSERIGPQIRWD